MVTGGESWVISQQYKTIYLTKLHKLDYLTYQQL